MTFGAPAALWLLALPAALVLLWAWRVYRRWVDVRTPMATVRAITFTINQVHERYARDLTDEEAAAAIAGASGFLGPCADYLINTVDHLAALGIHDRPLERLRDRVLARRAFESKLP